MCLSYLANSYFYNCKPFPRILRQHCVLRNLRKNKDIIITKPNKGNGVVIFDQKHHDNAVRKIISDPSKFEEVNEDPTLQREASLQSFLHKLKQKNFFNKNEYNRLHLSGSAPTLIYGTTKVHKFSSGDSFSKLRPFVSFIGSFNYNVACFLCDLLSPLVPKDYSCKDSFHLSISIIFSVSTLIMSIFYYLNYISLLLHVIIAHVVIYFIISM